MLKEYSYKELLNITLKELMSKNKNIVSFGLGIDDPKNITKQRTWTMSHNQSTGYGYTVKVDEKTDIDYLIFLIKQKQNVYKKVNS